MEKAIAELSRASLNHQLTSSDKYLIAYRSWQTFSVQAACDERKLRGMCGYMEWGVYVNCVTMILCWLEDWFLGEHKIFLTLLEEHKIFLILHHPNTQMIPKHFDKESFPIRHKTSQAFRLKISQIDFNLINLKSFPNHQTAPMLRDEKSFSIHFSAKEQNWTIIIKKQKLQKASKAEERVSGGNSK